MRILIIIGRNISGMGVYFYYFDGCLGIGSTVQKAGPRQGIGFNHHDI
jgi:hypothetical protein